MVRKDIINAGMAALAMAGTTACVQDKPKQQKNVIFLIVDDMRPELNCYGQEYMHTPNIDALASQGVLFNRAYCNAAVSGATRACLLTGTRPTRNTMFDAHMYVQQQKPDKFTMNEYFQQNGYLTIVSNGKTFHHQDDHEAGWDIVRPRYSAMEDYHIDLSWVPEGKRGPAFECVDLPDSCYTDGKITEQAIKDLRMLAAQDKPFFYGLGYFKPHLPFNVPEKYWKLYDRDSIKIPDNYVLKEGNNIPKRALPGWGEIRNHYTDMPKKRELLPEEMAKSLIHGYRAAVSFTDAQIGRVMEEMKALGLDKNTVIVLVGDHGWNLGEHGAWCKHSILETSIHSPLIIVDPDSRIKGHKSNEVVEFVSLFPTICDLVGLEIPEQMEAESIAPLVYKRNAKSKGWALCRWMQGYTLVTDDNYFYTEWWDREDNIEERLLFDHNVDPDENYNVVAEPEYQKVVEKLSPLLKERRGPEFDKYSGNPGDNVSD